jgi:hypothetical protein
MKLAICVHGIVGGSGGKNGSGAQLPLEELHSHIAKRVVKPNRENFDSIDFYIHTWSKDSKEDIKRIFSPAVLSAQKQKHFKCSSKNQRRFSKFYSLFKSIQLARGCISNDDIILSIRFDLFYRKDLNIIDEIADSIGKTTIDSKIMIINQAPGIISSGNDNKRLSDNFFFGRAKDMLEVFSESKYDTITKKMYANSEDTMNPQRGRSGLLDNHSIIYAVFRLSEEIQVVKLKNFQSEVHCYAYRQYFSNHPDYIHLR